MCTITVTLLIDADRSQHFSLKSYVWKDKRKNLQFDVTIKETQDFSVTNHTELERET